MIHEELFGIDYRIKKILTQLEENKNNNLILRFGQPLTKSVSIDTPNRKI